MESPSCSLAKADACILHLSDDHPAFEGGGGGWRRDMKNRPSRQGGIFDSFSASILLPLLRFSSLSSLPPLYFLPSISLSSLAIAFSCSSYLFLSLSLPSIFSSLLSQHQGRGGGGDAYPYPSPSFFSLPPLSSSPPPRPLPLPTPPLSLPLSHPSCTVNRIKLTKRRKYLVRLVNTY